MLDHWDSRPLFFETDNQETILANLNSCIEDARKHISTLEEIRIEDRFGKALLLLDNLVPVGCLNTRMAVEETLDLHLSSYTDDQNIIAAWEVLQDLYSNRFNEETYRNISLCLNNCSDQSAVDVCHVLVKKVNEYRAYELCAGLLEFLDTEDPLHKIFKDAIDFGHRSSDFYQYVLYSIDYPSLVNGDNESWEQARRKIAILRDDLCLEKGSWPIRLDANQQFTKDSLADVDLGTALEQSILNYRKMKSCLAKLDLPGAIDYDYIIELTDIFRRVDECLDKLRHNQSNAEQSEDKLGTPQTETVLAFEQLQLIISRSFSEGVVIDGQLPAVFMEAMPDETALHLIVQNLDYPQFKILIEDQKIPYHIINAKDGIGSTPIFSLSNWQANFDSTFNKLKLLVSKGADINHKNIHGYSFLNDIVSSSFLEAKVVEMLEYASSNGFDLSHQGDYSRSLMRSAIDRKRSKILQYLLRETSPSLTAMVDIQGYINNGYTPLDDAVSVKDNDEVIKILLDYGYKPVDKDEKDGFYRRIPTLFKAASKHHLSAIKLLLEYGDQLPQDPKDARHLLWVSTPSNREEFEISKATIELLVDSGLNINSCPEDQCHTFLDSVKRMRYDFTAEYIEFLRSKGARTYAELS